MTAELRSALLLAITASAVSACYPRARPAPTITTHSPTYEYRNGRWFDGRGFAERSVYVADGHFVAGVRGSADSIVDLDGAFVVPPFAEAHNHWLEANAIEAYNESYLRDGVFYLRDQGNPPSVRTLMNSRLNRATAVNFVGANQGWTGPGGHPLEIGRQFISFGVFPKGWTDVDQDGRLVMVVKNAADIAERWPTFIAGHPDFVKVFLLYSEDYARRSRDSTYQFRRGLDPALLPDIVQRAHAAGLKVSAHIYSAADFRTAVSAGVDIIAHFPGTGFDPALGVQAFQLSDADADLAARHRVVVITTLYWLGQQEDSTRNAMLLREVIRPNWDLLRSRGVPIIIGSDQFRATSLNEALVLVEKGLFTPVEALRTWSILTPREIFPGRKIGALTPGFEASFLVLTGNPLQDFNNVTHIRLRVKQGVPIQLSTPPIPFPRLGN